MDQTKLTYQQEYLFIGDTQRKLRLIEDHWREIALNQECIKLNPDFDRYEQLEQAGIFKLFTVRNETDIVGYFACFVMPHLHYCDHLYATNDVLYLKPEYRKGFTGIRLIKFAERCLKDDGVSVIQINTKNHKPFDPVLIRLGYSLADKVYSKVLLDKE